MTSATPGGRRPPGTRPALPAKRVSKEAVRRAVRARDRQALGAPLAAQLRTAAARRTGDGKDGVVTSPHLAGAVLGVTALALPLAGASLLAAAAAVPVLYAVGYLVARARRRRRALKSMEEELAVADAFDAFVEAHAPQLPAEAAESLQRAKASLGRVLPKLQTGHSRAALSADELFFLTQVATRYLPDAVAPFLALPPDYVGAPAAGHAKSPQALLLDQLSIVERGLDRIEEQLHRAEADRLARNRTLLERRRPG